MYCIWPFSTRQGLWRISSVGSGCSGSFFSVSPSPSFFWSFSWSFSFADDATPAPALAASPSPVLAAAFTSASALAPALGPSAGASSTSIICSLARSLAATDSVAAEPTTVVPGVAATDIASPLFAKAPSATELLTEALSSMSTSVSFSFFSLFLSSSATFLSRRALAFAAVDSTAAAVLACSSFFGGCNGSGYANSEGRAPHFKEKFLGILSFSVRPMSAFGVSVKENMWMSGNQYHICVKRQKPMAAPGRSTPDLENSDGLEFRPPASITPLARIAPKRVMTSSCLSPMTFCSFSLKAFTRSVLPGEVCM
mmetsp:Transcript_28796/g.82450  ORF Transcript_28796/g.82450 Transcript_28796/m.82450 type:complete len:312 (-) Transcript_28796:2196-3131(-)